jgi:MFS family permease
MYNAASGSLMTGLNPDPLIVSLVQVATTLPVFLLALPAGALADVVDRRRFLIVIEVATTIVSALFAALVGLDLVTPLSSRARSTRFPFWNSPSPRESPWAQASFTMF